MTEPSHAVFLSYASQDAEVAIRICEGLRAAGIEVWLDQSELRSGDAWDESIRDQISACALFIPIISANAHARVEGYFRYEWKLAIDRSHRIASKHAFLLPVVIDDTEEGDDAIPERFRELQWTRLLDGQTTPAFVQRVRRLLSPDASCAPTTPAASRSGTTSIPWEPVHVLSGARAVQLVFAVILVLALGYFVVDKIWLPRHATTSTVRTATTAQHQSSALPDKSIAVLPFADMSEKKDQDYFADGMAEEILDILAKIPQLTVIGRTSSFQFKGRTEDLRTIGEQLGAAYVVEGSVRKVGNRIRVTAQLIDTQSGAHTWSDSYDRGYGDVLTLQDEIATTIGRALQVTINSRDARPLRDERSTEAYTFYLRGRLALDNFSENSLLAAQTAFQQALQLDPTLLPAAEGLALTYLNRGVNENDITGRDAWELASAAAGKALQISANSASAHAVLGYVAGSLNFDWPLAEKEFQSALTLNPNDPDILIYAATLAVMHGDRERALRYIDTSVVLDPLNANAYANRGLVLYLSGDYSAAETALRKSIALNPGIDGNHMMLGFIKLLGGQREAALKEFMADPESSARDTGVAMVSHANGKKTESDAALVRVVDAVGNIWAYGVALIHAYRGERDEAFRWLERSRDARDGDLQFVFLDPLLVPLHSDPRWGVLMKSMNLAN